MEQTEGTPAARHTFDFTRWLYPAVACLYVLAVFLLYPLYRYRINPDQTALFSIAMKYARGDWLDAISSHWPPLLTWLIALGLKAGLKIVPATTLIDTAAGLLTLWSCNRLASRLGATRTGRICLLLLSAVYGLLFIFDETRTDTLFTSILLWYFILLSEDASLRNAKAACVAGAVAGLAYYARPYAFFFVPAHLAVLTVVEGWAAPQLWRAATRRAGVVIVTMFAVAAPWIICISCKYHHFTINSAGESGFRQSAPSVRGSGMVNIGLGAPPNATAYNYWEDPTRLNLPPWSPFQSRADLESYFGMVGMNFLRLIAWNVRLSIAAAAICLVVLVRWTRGARDRTTTVLLSAAVIYAAGICLSFVVDRYMWPIAICIMAMALSLPRNSILCTALALSFVPHPVSALYNARHQGEKEHAIAQTLHGQLHMRGNVASLSRWLDSLYICYYAELPYYGIPVIGSAADIQRQLAQYKIGYLFVWNDRPVPPHLLEGMRKVNLADLPGEIQVYMRARPQD
jgi:Dolichyl-phosphate-mannose-protein mannosyltransferase